MAAPSRKRLAPTETGLRRSKHGPESDERVDELDRVVLRGRTHVFGVKRVDARFETRGQEHAVPVGEALAVSEVEGIVKNCCLGQNQREHAPVSLKVAAQNLAGNTSLMLPASELCSQFGDDLPKQDCWLRLQ